MKKKTSILEKKKNLIQQIPEKKKPFEKTILEKTVGKTLKTKNNA